MTDSAAVLGEYVPSGWFVSRVPLLAFDEVLAWGRQVSDPLAGILPAAMYRPEVRTAVALASPSLAERLSGGARPNRGGTGDRADRALIRYFLRMAGRPTPFGLFATCSLGTVGDRTQLTVAPASSIRRRTRLDSGYVTMLSETLGKEPYLRRRMILRPNPTAHRVGDRVRYIEVRMNDEAVRDHYLTEVRASDPLMDALSLAAAKDVTTDDLVDSLVRAGHDAEPASRFVAELLDAHLLFGDLDPPVTGRDPMAHLLEALPVTNPSRIALASIDGMLSAHDSRSIADHPPPDIHADVATALQVLPCAVDPATLLHVEARRPNLSATIGTPVIDALRHGIDVLHRAGRPWRDAGLDRFRREFADRFGHDWMPVLLALDEESGIGYLPAEETRAEVSPVLAGLAPTAEPGPRRIEWSSREQRLLTLLHRAWTSRELEIVLDSEDVAALTVDDVAQLPDAFAAICRVSASDGATNEDHADLYLDGAVGPSGIRLLGRLCDLEPDLEHAVRKHVLAEESLTPHAVFAEVVHRPQGRLGNVVHRPTLRRWEIPVLDPAGVPRHHEISLNDLYVAVVENRIRLFSAALGREVLPRMSNAHDYYADANLGLYAFLCALQNEGSVGALRWSWEPFNEAPFLPRVRSGPAVLSRAQWTLLEAEIAGLFDSEGNLSFPRLEELRTERGLPRFVYVVDEHSELLTDLENALAVQSIAPLLRGRPMATVIEVYPDPGHLAACGSEGSFVHELVVPFQRMAPAAGAPPVLPPTTVRPGHAAMQTGQSSVRNFPPGSEWLYVKVFTGRSEADRLLVGPLAEVIRECVSDGAIEGWFFLRYADPAPHLRLRLKIPPTVLATRCRDPLEKMLAREFDEGRVRAVTYDVYRREVERYGGRQGVVLAEQIFQVDSESVLSVLPHLAGDSGGVHRWVTALLGIDRLLTDLGLDLDRRRVVIAGMRESLEREFRVGPAERAAIHARLRPHRRQLLRLLEGEDIPELVPSPVLQSLDERTARMMPHAEAMRLLAANGSLTQPVDTVAASLAHLFVNRLLRGAHRRQELVLTSFLDRLYDSVRARH